MTTEQRLAALLSKANDLPLSSGVYIMKDKSGRIIYVGKSKKLKNRVTSYFRGGHKNLKTQRMVLSVHDFDVIFVDSEIEALTLENTLIKKHTPRYNIKLKDAKSYPYIKIDIGSPYPRLTMTRKREADRARYFGPYTGTSDVYRIIDMLNKTLCLASCKREFPRDIGKKRPCIYKQMNRCLAPCTGEISEEKYRERVMDAVEVLRGNISRAKEALFLQMLAYSEEENYEAAAMCRDSIASLEKIKEKQKVVASPDEEFDIVGVYEGDVVSCISVLNVRSGSLVNKEDFLIGADTVFTEDTVVTFLVDYYADKEYLPHEILLGAQIGEDDLEALSGLFREKTGRKCEFRIPERGEKAKLAEMACENAREKVRLETVSEVKANGTLTKLAAMLGLEVYPTRIEAYDISNIGSEHKTCGMIVAEDGRFKKADYRQFKIKSVEGTDDYASMREAIGRRLDHLSDAEGSYSVMPDLILLDGGAAHVGVIRELMAERGRDIPVFGMVKDEHHKTRALCTDSEDISIAREQDVFRFIYGLQEEVHRFSVKRMGDAKRKTLKTSTLTEIKGIGPAKAKKLFDAFDSLDGIKNASIEQLTSHGFSMRDAEAISAHFADEEKRK